MVPKVIESALITARVIGKCDEFSISGGACTAPLFTQKSCHALQRVDCMRGILQRTLLMALLAATAALQEGRQLGLKILTRMKHEGW